MKLTPDNELCLKLMGFVPEDPADKTGWWRLDDGEPPGCAGWSFVLGKIPNIKSLVKRLMKTEYERGVEHGHGLPRD